MCIFFILSTCLFCELDIHNLNCLSMDRSRKWSNVSNSHYHDHLQNTIQRSFTTSKTLETYKLPHTFTSIFHNKRVVNQVLTLLYKILFPSLYGLTISEVNTTSFFIFEKHLDMCIYNPKSLIPMIYLTFIR